MDPITARAVLRLPPGSTPTAGQVDAAHRAAVWERHPSRYADRDQRAAAVGWMSTLDAARAALLAEAGTPAALQPPPVEPATQPAAPSAPSPAPSHPWAPVAGPGAVPVAVQPGAGPSAWAAAVTAGSAAPATTTPRAPERRRRLGAGWIVGIAAGVVLLVALMVGVVYGAVALGERLSTFAESSEGASSDDPDVDHYTARETMFSFPAALELYWDGRYTSDCPIEYELGCWEAAVIPEASCAIMTVSYAFATTEDQLEPDLVESDRFYDIEAGETVPIVFGNDEYDYGWPLDVVCHDGIES
ncbi:hypothetical protein [Agromyces sp. NPDC058064]|uniref:hypothetical protein n=1 Tax=Agromyces sp. NPDC058064 TaxID=3346322 RepID=UPI0036DBD014